MSAFKTCIPVDVNGVRALLPKESFVEGVEWNELTQQVEVTWSNRNCVTPFSVPVEFPIQMLHDKALPPGATIKEYQAVTFVKPSPIVGIIVTDNVKAVDRRGRRGVKVLP